MAALTSTTADRRRRRPGVYGPPPPLLHPIAEQVTETVTPNQPDLADNSHPKTSREGERANPARTESEVGNGHQENDHQDPIVGVRKISRDEMGQLKKYAVKLRLETRRPSYLKWKSRHIDSLDKPVLEENTTAPCSPSRWTEEWKNDIDEALRRLRQDLIQMRNQDQFLARQLMEIRRSIHDAKMTCYYLHNKELLDEAILDAQRDDIDEICDLPPRLFSPALKQYGLTKMNVQTRRFSVF